MCDRLSLKIMTQHSQEFSRDLDAIGFQGLIELPFPDFDEKRCRFISGDLF